MLKVQVKYFAMFRVCEEDCQYVDGYLFRIIISIIGKYKTFVIKNGQF